MELRNRVAVITGGAGGIGRAIAHRLGDEGMRVMLADVSPEPLDAAVSELSAAGVDVAACITDVTDPASVEHLADETLQRFGDVHVVCNNAGVGGVSEGFLWEHDLADWRWGIDVNVLGVIHVMRSFVPRLLAAGEGYMVNTCSGNGGFAPIAKGAMGGPAGAVYPMTKAAVLCLSESLYIHLDQANEIAPHGVRCGVLFPGGFLDTNIWQSWKQRPDAYAPTQARHSPLVTIDDVVDRLADAGVQVQFTPLSTVAEYLVDGLQHDRFWMLAPPGQSFANVGNRARSIAKGTLPRYLIHDLLAESATANAQAGDHTTEST